MLLQGLLLQSSHGLLWGTPISAPLVTRPVLCFLLYLGIHIGLIDCGRLEDPGVGQS